MSAKKGSCFEREICKLLSSWWSRGKRDDVFWRSSQSGGRATQRMKQGKSTYGSYGDIAAIDPIGDPLMKVVTIELKRGSYQGRVGDLLECKPSPVQQPFEKALAQAYRSHQDAQSLGWLLVSRPDHRVAMAYLDWKVAQQFKEIIKAPVAKYSLFINNGTSRQRMQFVGMPLDYLLARWDPQAICRIIKA